ncbi:MAG: serine hydrolase [Rubrivivax sp.]
MPTLPSPRLQALLLALTTALCGCASWRVDRAVGAAAGFASHTLCDDVFVTGVEPGTAYAERVAPLPGMGLVRWALQHQVDTQRREVTVTIGDTVRRARWRQGLGCVALPGEVPDLRPDLATPAEAAPAPDPWGPEPVRAIDGRLDDVLQRALADQPGQPPHRTKALLVLHHGRPVAEAYAPGYGVDTPVLGFSMSKSLTNALVGALVQQGRLSLAGPAPVPAWHTRPDDARGAITVEQLLRQTSGLDLPQDNSGFDLNAHVMYTVPDKAAAVVAAGLAAAPGERWAYTDTHYLLLGRLALDALGGEPAELLRFATRELFAPAGLRHVHLDLDAAGTPIASSHGLASARDWARLGQLFLDDGVAGGRRLLPPGWVAMSTTPTLDTGYGAGWWTNRRPGLVPGWGVPWGLPGAPADTFFARGFMGNFVVVVPSRRVVLVRLSVSTQRGDDIAETDRIVAEVLQALPR